MRSLHVVGAIGGVGLLAACGRGEGIEMLQRQPRARALEQGGPLLRRASGDGTGSTVALARLGARRLALVADADAGLLRILDTKTEEELPVTPLDGAPSQIVIAPDGRVYVAVRDRAEIEVLGQAPGVEPSLHVLGRIATAGQPTAGSLTP